MGAAEAGEGEGEEEWSKVFEPERLPVRLMVSEALWRTARARPETVRTSFRKEFVRLRGGGAVDVAEVAAEEAAAEVGVRAWEDL